MTVYADVLVGLNIIITYLIIVSVRLISKRATNKWGVGIASLIGGFSSLIIFYEDIPVLVSVIYKLLVAGLITGVGFLPRSVRGFLKVFLSFFAISFLFGGVMYALEITFNPQNILYMNGTVYFDMSITYLVGSVLLIYGAFMVVNFLLTKHAVKNKIYEVKITFRNTEITLRGFGDTGNNLKYGVSARPVIIGELSALAPIFSFEELKILKSGMYENIPDTLVGKLHLVPCQTISGDCFLPAVIPEKVEIKSGNKKTNSLKFCLALSNKKLSDGEYNVILHNSIIDAQWEESKPYGKHN